MTKQKTAKLDLNARRLGQGILKRERRMVLRIGEVRPAPRPAQPRTVVPGSACHPPVCSQGGERWLL